MKSSPTHPRKSSTMTSHLKSQHPTSQTLSPIPTALSPLSSPSHRGRSFRARTSCARMTRRFRCPRRRVCAFFHTKFTRREQKPAPRASQGTCSDASSRNSSLALSRLSCFPFFTILICSRHVGQCAPDGAGVIRCD
jgi:hypothetical protein